MRKVKNTSKKMLVYLLVFSMIVTICPYGSVYAEGQGKAKMANSNLMFNDYIGLYVDNTGKFSIGTTGGNPENDRDNNQKLLFGYSNGSTSYTTICVDGNIQIFNALNAVFDADTAKHTSERDINGIHIVQTLSFCKNSATGREDVVEIKYTVTNNADKDKNVGCRIMLDTQLGGNDNAPFRVPGYGAITTETEFEGEEIPQIWQAFDNLSNPGVVAQGRFYRSEKDRPDKVQFANWRGLRDTSWNYKINKGSGNGDSAVSATWYEKPLAAGETREYRTYYGLSELTQDLTGPLILSVYSESELEVEGNDYVPNPFPVNAYIENIGSETMEAVRVSLELPEGLSFADGSTKTIDIGEMKTNVIVQKNWQVKAEPSITEQYYKMKVVLEYGNGESKSVTRTVHVPALKKKAKQIPKALQYALFSRNSEKSLEMYGWQSYITGNVYSGKDYIYQGSILNITGKADTVGTVTTGGWQINIDEINENQTPVEMPDLDADIMGKAGDMESYSDSITFSEDTTVLEHSIYSEKDISFPGTNFIGDGYVIAKQNITCGLNQGSTYNDGKVVMYAKEGDITLNGSEIALDGILYAPHGTVYINSNIFRLRGRIIADYIVMNASQVFIESAENDIYYIYDTEYEEEEEPIQRGFYEKTFLEEEIAQAMSEDGVWTTVCDAGAPDTDWNHVTWNGVRMDDSDIVVTAAVSGDGETYSEEMPVKNGSELEGIHGRYLKVTAKLQKSSSEKMPRLIDITISTEDADLVTNASPVLNLSQSVYETEIDKPVTILLESYDDAVGGRSSYQLSLNAEDDEQKKAVDITDISPLEKEVCIQESGSYDFTVSVSDGELHSEQLISILVRDPAENTDDPDTTEEPDPGEGEQEYTIISAIEKMAFNDDFSSLQIIGTASAEGHLKKYTLSYGKEGEGSLQVIREGEQEVQEDVLGAIPTAELEEGSYVLVLKVEDEYGNVSECRAVFKLNARDVEMGGNSDDEDDDEEEGDSPSGGGQEQPDGTLSEEELNSLREAKRSAVEWLKAQADEQGSWPQDGLMNTTCEALAVLQYAGNSMESAAFDAWSSGEDGRNVDEQCHAIWGRPNRDAMNRIWEQQNADGGFGLTKTYTSDTYDTLLVLMTEIYMQQMGYNAVDSQKLMNAINYIVTRRNADGGFGYTEKDESRTLLTAEYAIILAKLNMTLANNDTISLYCNQQYTGDFSETVFLEQGMLAEWMYHTGRWTMQDMQAVLSVQRENGSIYDNVEDTMVFIVLVDDMIEGGE